MPKNNDAGEIKIEKETALSARINGNQNQAMVIVKKALKVVLEKAKASGIGIAGTFFNTVTSSGAIGYVASEIIRQDLVRLVFASSPPRVATAGSYEPIFGTNPLAIGIPAKSNSIVLNMTTQLLWPFTGVACSGVGDNSKNWGHLVFAIDPGFLGNRDEFINNVTTLIKNVKATKKLPETGEIFVPGEKGNRQSKQIRTSGKIEIEENLLQELRKMAG